MHNMFISWWWFDLLCWRPYLCLIQVDAFTDRCTPYRLSPHHKQLRDFASLIFLSATLFCMMVSICFSWNNSPCWIRFWNHPRVLPLIPLSISLSHFLIHYHCPCCSRRFPLHVVGTISITSLMPRSAWSWRDYFWWVLFSAASASLSLCVKHSDACMMILFHCAPTLIVGIRKMSNRLSDNMRRFSFPLFASSSLIRFGIMLIRLWFDVL